MRRKRRTRSVWTAAMVLVGMRGTACRFGFAAGVRLRRPRHGHLHVHGHIHRHVCRRWRGRSIAVAQRHADAHARTEHRHEADRNQRAQQKTGQKNNRPATRTSTDQSQRPSPGGRTDSTAWAILIEKRPVARIGRALMRRNGKTGPRAGAAVHGCRRARRHSESSDGSRSTYQNTRPELTGTRTGSPGPPKDRRRPEVSVQAIFSAAPSHRDLSGGGGRARVSSRRRPGALAWSHRQ